MQSKVPVGKRQTLTRNSTRVDSHYIDMGNIFKTHGTKCQSQPPYMVTLTVDDQPVRFERNTGSAVSL